MSLSDTNTTRDLDPKKLLVVLDYDEICYRLTGSQFGFFKTSFALTATNLIPDFQTKIHQDDLAGFTKSKTALIESGLSGPELDSRIRLKEAFHTAVSGWLDHKDCVHYFVEHIQDEQKKSKMMEDIDRMAHSILPTHLWEPIAGLAKDIEDLRELGAEVVIWTHGRREMVNRTFSQNGLLGLFSDSQIFDKQTLLEDNLPLGRKDRGSDSFARFFLQHGVLPENVALLDDTKGNHKSAAQAGTGLRVWVDWEGSAEKLMEFPKVKADNTSEGMQVIKSFIKQRNLELGVVHQPANDQQAPAMKLARLNR